MRSILGSICILALLTLAPPAAADLVSGPDILPAAPPNVDDDFPGAENDHQQGFNEKQDHTLGVRIEIDPLGIFAALPQTEIDSGKLYVKAGTYIDSHMIFLNTPVGAGGASDTKAWLFAGTILGVMSDQGGTREAASSAEVGAPGTFYPGAFGARGLEGNDSYTVFGPDMRSILVDMNVSEPGDWIRVITTGQPVPEPGTLALCGIAITFIAWRRRKRAA